MSAGAPRAAQWLNGVPIELSKVLFFIGSGDADLRAELARRGWKGRVIVVAPPAFDGLDQLAATLEPDSEQPVVALDPAVMREHRDAVKQAARLIARTWFGARANQEAKQKNGALYRNNTLRNVRSIAAEADAAVLRDAFGGLPALVIGAGPSLDRNIADIAAHRDRALIIAADTALRPLLAAGIQPHIVVAADPSETNARHLCDLPPCPATALVAEGSVDPEALCVFTGRTFFCRVGDHDPWPWLNERGIDCGKLRSWGSVLTTAFDLARTMGCSPIVFAGADLAFTDGRPYARGTTYEEVWYQAATWGQAIESSWAASIGSWPVATETGVDGAGVRTAPHLRSFRDWIATEAARLARGSVINGSGGGILTGECVAQAALGPLLATLAPTSVDLFARLIELHQSSRRIASLHPEIEAANDGPRSTSAVPKTNAPASCLSAPEPEVELILESGDLLAQIERAWSALGDRHRLVLIDRTGVADGAPVRRALFAFQGLHPGVSARFGRFFDPLDDRSWIDRRPVAVLSPGDDRSKWQPEHRDTAHRLTPLIVETLKPASVLDLGCGAGYWAEALEKNGVSDVVGVEEGLGSYTPARRFDLCLCLGVVHRVPMRTAIAALAACTMASDTVVFSVPAAATGAPGCINERPWSFWHRLFLEYGYLPSDELRAGLEDRCGRYQSAFDLLMAYRRVALPGQIDDRIARVVLDNANRSDEQLVHRHWLTRLLDAERSGGPRALPNVAAVDFEMPPARMEATAARGERLFRYRSAAASLAAETASAAPVVMEDGTAVAATAHQGYVTFVSSDLSDPRHNGRTYTVRVPAYVAFLEAQPPSVIIHERL